MINQLTRIASLVLAFGFFIACSTTQNTSQISTDSTEKEIRQKLSALDEQINTGEDTPDLYFQKGSLLTKLAKKQEDPAQRSGLYADAYMALTQAAELYEETSGANSEKVEELLNVTWSNEHNQGVQILQRDTTNARPDYNRAAAHFRNATIIIPDSAISYKMGARAHYKNKQPQKAIDVLENARQNVHSIPSPLLEQLAFLYLEKGNPKKAVEIYEQAESFSNRNLNLLHGLANAYINTEQHQKAIELLQQLSAKKPENVIYGESLATELYFLATKKLDVITTNLRQGKQVDNTLFTEVDSLLLRAEDQFKKILDKNSRDRQLKLSFAKFYQNSASKYQQLLPFINEQREGKIRDKINNYISNSIPLFEQLVAKESNDEQLWQNLYQAYSYLGMKEKAQKAKSNL